jgi:drug/metabolite transporter (DMT)-like permease
MQAKAITALLVLGVLFGAAFLFMKVIVEEIAATELVLGRLALGALTIVIVMAVMGKRPRITPSSIASVTLLAVLDSIIPYTLVAWAEVKIDSGVASVLISTLPLFTVLFASVTLPDERLSSRGFLGLASGFVGVIVLTGGDILDITSGSTVAMFAVVGAAMSYGAASVYARSLLRKQGALEITSMKLVAGTAIAAVITFSVEGVPNYGALSLEGGAALIALGVLSTGVAFTGYLWLVGNSGSVFASLVTYVVPVAGLLLGWSILGESIGLSTALGTALIASGVAGVMYHPKQEVKTVESPRPIPVLRTTEEYA